MGYRAVVLAVEEKARYMDDIRIWQYCVRLGWIWDDGQLCYRREWREEESAKGMSGLEKTLEVMDMMMN